ncbi:MAG: glycosyltransferase family 4 protein [Lachnospiraceae bacterium]|nr:glycosyltransferase family 4 protein [Lachnospiraceae bacterium]
MKKVLILTNSISGIVQFRMDLMRTLREEGYRVYLSCPGEYLYENYEKKLKESGCRIFRHDFSRHGMNPAKELDLIRYYRALCKKVSPDIVLTYTIKPNIYGGAAARGLKIPCIGNVTGLGVAIENPGLLKTVTLTLYRWGVRKDRLLFFQNSANRDFFVNERIIGQEKTSVLPGSGVDLEEHGYEPYPQDGPVTFLYIGRQTKDKGYGELIQAAKRVREKRPQVKFISLGLCEEEFREEHDRLGAASVIEEAGFQEDVGPWLRQCSALILPSYHEGMSNVLLEAAAAGRPVIATDVPGCRETYIDGATGFSCRRADVDSLEEAILKMADLSPGEREEMGRAGRKYVEENFDRRLVTEKYMAEIRRI